MRLDFLHVRLARAGYRASLFPRSDSYPRHIAVSLEDGATVRIKPARRGMFTINDARRVPGDAVVAAVRNEQSSARVR